MPPRPRLTSRCPARSGRTPQKRFQKSNRHRNQGPHVVGVESRPKKIKFNGYPTIGTPNLPQHRPQRNCGEDMGGNKTVFFLNSNISHLPKPVHGEILVPSRKYFEKAKNGLPGPHLTNAAQQRKGERITASKLRLTKHVPDQPKQAANDSPAETNGVGLRTIRKPHEIVSGWGEPLKKTTFSLLSTSYWPTKRPQLGFCAPASSSACEMLALKPPRKETPRL